MKAIEGEEAERALRQIVEEARRLVDDQRRALRRADFGALLAATTGFQGLAERVSAFLPAGVPPDATAELRGLREQVLRQSQLLEHALAATPTPSRGYARKSAPPVGSSILVDRYA